MKTKTKTTPETRSKAKARTQTQIALLAPPPQRFFLVTLTWSTEMTLILALFDTLSKAIRYAARDVLKAEMRRRPRTVIFDSDMQTRWFKGRNGRFYLSIHEMEIR